MDVSIKKHSKSYKRDRGVFIRRVQIAKRGGEPGTKIGQAKFWYSKTPNYVPNPFQKISA